MYKYHLYLHLPNQDSFAKFYQSWLFVQCSKDRTDLIDFRQLNMNHLQDPGLHLPEEQYLALRLCPLQLEDFSYLTEHLYKYLNNDNV